MRMHANDVSRLVAKLDDALEEIKKLTTENAENAENAESANLKQRPPTQLSPSEVDEMMLVAKLDDMLDEIKKLIAAHVALKQRPPKPVQLSPEEMDEMRRRVKAYVKSVNVLECTDDVDALLERFQKECKF